jgi:hypothetical protein
LKPKPGFGASLVEAVSKGIHSASENLAVMAVLLAAMSLVVALYYFVPSCAAILTWYGNWQAAGGIVRAALVAGFAGGILSEISVVYVRDQGRWSLDHLENMAFRFVVFFIGGLAVYELYQWQAVWFGNGISWRVLLPKVLVDQFIFSAFWSTPYQSITFRWHALRYSTAELRSELGLRFVLEHMLPVLVTNWMFWIPGVTLVYAMPLILQMPLNVFATAIWSVLLAGLAKSPARREAEATPQPLVP